MNREAAVGVVAVAVAVASLYAMFGENAVGATLETLIRLAVSLLT